MAFELSKLSQRRLQGVHPDLVKVVKRAIQITEVDFRVQEGLRSVSTQKKYLAAGKSQTMNSRHITGHAVDLVAMIGGRIQWELSLYFRIASAMSKAADELGIPIRWGGCWTKINDLSPVNCQKLVESYSAGRRAAKKPAFIDAPHFELLASKYP